jgi:hypothetical protein
VRGTDGVMDTLKRGSTVDGRLATVDRRPTDPLAGGRPPARR